MKPESPNRARPRMLVVVNAIVLLLAGPAGAGKSTLARAWCHTRLVAAHVQLDTVRDLLVQGLVDPRAVGEPGQARTVASVRHRDVRSGAILRRVRDRRRRR